MKIVFLIPPSEWKNSENLYQKEELSFVFEKPLIIAKNASEKDLKCTWKRFEEAINLNKNIEKSWSIESIKRYSWVMYNAIDYFGMSEIWKNYFSENFLIFSWIYWILKPQDKISNYKLPIETKWLSKYWQEIITNSINNLEADYIVDLLPNSYKKMIDFKKISSKIIEVNFLNSDWKKISHWVKKIKWEWIKKMCNEESKNLFVVLECNSDKYYFKNIYVK